MPLNLDQKILLLLEDIQSLSRHEAARRIKTLVEAELNYIEAEHIISVYDVEAIKSQAVQNLNNETIGYGTIFAGELDRLRSWSYISAVISFLRQKGLIKFLIKLEDKRRY